MKFAVVELCTGFVFYADKATPEAALYQVVAVDLQLDTTLFHVRNGNYTISLVSSLDERITYCTMKV